VVVTARWHKAWPERIEYLEQPVARIGPAPVDRWTTWRYVQRLRGWLKANTRPGDVVLAIGLRHEAWAARRAVGGRMPVILGVHNGGAAGDCFWQVETAGGRRIKQACLKADAFVAASRSVEDELKAAGYPRDRIGFIPTGVEIGVSRSDERRAQARGMLASASDALRLPSWAPLGIHVGRIESGRGLEYLIAAWEPVARRWPNARLWLVGPTRDGGGGGGARLDRQVGMLGLGGRVHRLGVFAQVEELLAAADVMVHPTRGGDPSLAVVEALGAGLPVVAADSRGHREVIEHEKTGLLVPGDDAGAIGEAVARVIAAPDPAARLGDEARRWAAEQRSLPEMVDRYKGLLDRLTAG
jgi:glycosyltransferase involved in cell wall biosynthesis